LFNSKVRNLTDIVEQVLNETSRPIPVNFVLGVIQRESGGIVGNYGNGIAMGLMQVLRGTLASFNDKQNKSYTKQDMIGTSNEDAMRQIEVGTWYLQRCLLSVNKMNPFEFTWPKGPLGRTQGHYADMSYVAGINGFRKFRERALNQGFADTPQALRLYRNTYETTWGQPNRPFDHAKGVWALASGNDDRPAPSSPVQPKTGGGGIGFLILIIAFVAKFFKKGN